MLCSLLCCRHRHRKIHDENSGRCPNTEQISAFPAILQLSQYKWTRICVGKEDWEDTSQSNRHWRWSTSCSRRWRYVIYFHFIKILQGIRHWILSLILCRKHHPTECGSGVHARHFHKGVSGEFLYWWPGGRGSDHPLPWGFFQDGGGMLRRIHCEDGGKAADRRLCNCQHRSCGWDAASHCNLRLITCMRLVLLLVLIFILYG